MSDFGSIIWNQKKLNDKELEIANNHLEKMKEEKSIVIQDYRKKRNNKLKLIEKTEELLIHYNLELTILEKEVTVINKIIERGKMGKLLEYMKENYKDLDKEISDE